MADVLCLPAEIFQNENVKDTTGGSLTGKTFFWQNRALFFLPIYSPKEQSQNYFITCHFTTEYSEVIHQLNLEEYHIREKLFPEESFK